MLIRRATRDDYEAIGRVFVRARDSMAYLPRIPEADRPRLGGWIAERHEVWVAERDEGVVGFAGLSPGWLDHLYVDPDSQNRGIGTELLLHALQLQPRGLRLWLFQKNDGARRFYERHYFRLEKVTDGSGNMEREPDALYVWHPVLKRRPLRRSRTTRPESNG